MQVDFNPSRWLFSIRDPDVPGFSVQDASAWIRFRTGSGRIRQVSLAEGACSTQQELISDVHGPGRQLIVQSDLPQENIQLTFRINQYDQRSFVLLRLSFTNLSREPLYLDQFCLCQADQRVAGKLEVADRTGQLRFFKVGWHGWAHTGLLNPVDKNSNRISDWLGAQSYSNPLTARPYSAGEFWSEGWGVLASDQCALVAGFVSTDHQFGQLYARLNPADRAVSLFTQLDGIRLDPCESCDSEWGYLQFVHLPKPEPALEFVEAVARQMNARLSATPPPPMWTHWYHFYHRITAQLFLKNLDVLSGQSDVLPFEVAELDDGYQSAWGDWSSSNDKFPHGLSDLARQVKSRGFIPGLWLAPFTVAPNSDIARQHPEWLVQNDHGNPMRVAFVYYKFMHALDLSQPQILDHVRRLMEQVSQQWGFGMVKVDFINTAALPGRRHNIKLTRAECLRHGLEAIRAGVGEDTFLLACGCPFGPAIGIVDAMRIGPDTAPSWEPYFHWIPWAGSLIKKEKSPPSLRNAMRHTLNLGILHRRWWWNDPDCLLVRDNDTRLTEAEVQSAVTVVGLSGGMLVSSDDLRTLNPERLHWLSLLLPQVDLHAVALDLLEEEMPRMYYAKVQGNCGDYHLLGLFNWGDSPADRRVDFSRLGLNFEAGLDVFDFWHNRLFHTDQPEMAFTAVPPHGSVLLRICQSRPICHIVGDTMHISQGAELAGWHVESGSLRLETLDFHRKVAGDLWLWLPQPPISVQCNGELVNTKSMGDNVYVLHLVFSGMAMIDVKMEQ